MPHIHTDTDQHDVTVTAYIIRTDGDELRALVHMHKKHKRLLPIGGHVELLETPWQAIAHELEEESGYNLTQLRVLQPQSRITSLTNVVQHPYPISINTHEIPPRHFHTDLEYGFVTQEDPHGIVGEDESTDLRWMTQAELNATQPPDIYVNTKDVYNFMFDEALSHWDQVATSEFIQQFPDELKES